MVEQTSSKALSWEELTSISTKEEDRFQGPTNPYSTLRLFGQDRKDIRVILYRDHHAWCPYCQKIWLWLEWKRIPYKVKKVTMRCYGSKEPWYLKKVPSGMLPALELDEKLITESDSILIALENTFGSLGSPLEDLNIMKLRNLERKLFQAWCLWLCTPFYSQRQEEAKKKYFQEVAEEMENNLVSIKGSWLDSNSTNEQGFPIPSSADVIFIPYIERMNASLAYYKGFSLRQEHPAINEWLMALEKDEIYRGTQGDFHTHAHDLPPQMGGCWSYPNPQQKLFSHSIDIGEGLGKQETTWAYKEHSTNDMPEQIALTRVLKHRDKLLALNPLGAKNFDQPLRASLTQLITNKTCTPEPGSAFGLRYLRDRISVPRDMPLLSARRMRQVLEETAKIDSMRSGPPIPTKNRLDQNPRPFLESQIRNSK